MPADEGMGLVLTKVDLHAAAQVNGIANDRKVTSNQSIDADS